eukprot:GHVH01012940.1.p1 GENE.GHVH01012940.1~~GHVH01012940.1.p1  ORF type:complete len:125 (+),score=11.40 GHVH01012940.1:194-568(+)
MEATQEMAWKFERSQLEQQTAQHRLVAVPYELIIASTTTPDATQSFTTLPDKTTDSAYAAVESSSDQTRMLDFIFYVFFNHCFDCVSSCDLFGTVLIASCKRVQTEIRLDEHHTRAMEKRERAY